MLTDLANLNQCLIGPVSTIQEKKLVVILSSHTPAHDVAVTVAPFRAWRGSQLTIARGPTRTTIAEGLRVFV